MSRRETKNMATARNMVAIKILSDSFERIARNMYVWDGLPKNSNGKEFIKSEHIENFLYENGQCAFFNHEMLGTIALKCKPSGGYNILGYPVALNTYGFGYSEWHPMEKCVWVRNNSTLTPTQDIVNYYVDKLVNISRTIDVNLNNVKLPALIKGTKETEFTLRNIYDNVLGNEVAVFVDEALNMNAFEVFNLNAPFIANELVDLFRSIQSELLTALGINNSNIDKKERVLVDEVNSNNEAINYNLNTFLDMRKQACEEFNEMFGGNLSVRLRHEENNKPKEDSAEDVKEGNDDGKV